uniref:Uncharacterized protein n=1 Tax=Rousettus aegyptiacus TaxID=9407 RepID=A0A7J8H191_ROUAE|nr:hypothetical protein HJG63_011292 [Rousettus aegyptiacus]
MFIFQITLRFILIYPIIFLTYLFKSGNVVLNLTSSRTDLIISLFTNPFLCLFLTLFGSTIHSPCLMKNKLKNFFFIISIYPIGKASQIHFEDTFTIPTPLYLLSSIKTKSPSSLYRLLFS